jgi:N-acetylated-alpha-linked acidic dipeptidase
MLLRIANADVLPYDYAEFARTMRRYIAPIDRSIAEHRWSARTTPLVASIDRLEREAQAFNTARDAALTSAPVKETLQHTNQALMQVERSLLRPQGLKTRPWFRNLIYVADENNGYANMVFPSVNEAIRANDASLTQTEIDDLASRFDQAAQALVDARAALGAR